MLLLLLLLSGRRLLTAMHKMGKLSAVLLQVMDECNAYLVTEHLAQLSEKPPLPPPPPAVAAMPSGLSAAGNLAADSITVATRGGGAVSFAPHASGLPVTAVRPLAESQPAAGRHSATLANMCTGSIVIFGDKKEVVVKVADGRRDLAREFDILSKSCTGCVEMFGCETAPVDGVFGRGALQPRRVSGGGANPVRSGLLPRPRRVSPGHQAAQPPGRSAAVQGLAVRL